MFGEERLGEDRPPTGAKNPIAGAILRWLPAVAWMALIFVLSSRSDLPTPPGTVLELLFEKGAHIGSYAVLAFLLERALALPQGGKRTALVLTMLYAISDEFHQSFTPGRTPSVTDGLADLAGALLGLYVPGLRGALTGGRARSLRDRRDPSDGAPPA